MDVVILSAGLTDDIMSAVDNAKENRMHFELYLGQVCAIICALPWQDIRSLTSNGHFGMITIATSKSFPVEASVIKPFFVKAPTSSPDDTAQPHTIVLHPAGHDSKEVEALQGQAKLSLFFIGCVVEFEKVTVKNVMYTIDPPCIKISTRIIAPREHPCLLVCSALIWNGNERCITW